MLEQQPGGARLRLAELVAALSLATDLGMGQPMEWALRSCLLGVRLGAALGMSEGELHDVFYLALLRFVGCTAEAHQHALVYGDELAIGVEAATVDFGNLSELLPFMLRNVGAGRPPLRRARILAATMIVGPRAATASTLTHCEVAARLAERLGFGAGVQAALWQMFERWDGQGMPKHLKGEAIALPVRVVQLAHHADPFYRRGGAAAAVAMARRRAGKAYDPAIVEYFCRAAPDLFAGLELESIWDAALAAEPGQRAWVAEQQLDEACRAIADFADLKSPYTVGHSSGVAELAYAAVQRYGLPESDAVAVRRAGLLHDLGRVGVSARIWGKPGPLTPGEWERVRLHPYLTERILARAPVLAQLGALAALHHERLDGSGYYRGLPGSLLPPAARLLAAADAYHAMTEPRPHRPARTPEVAAEELRREVQAGRLDASAADAVLSAAGHQVRRSHAARAGGLSAREVEVLRLIARGLSNRQMAQRLSIAEKTVGHHIQHIYDKIGVSTRAAATLFAMQHDLLEHDTSET
jgi:HD-GYP domain-containing protein (c-di-GMP phosphodiesterase class II)